MYWESKLGSMRVGWPFTGLTGNVVIAIGETTDGTPLRELATKPNNSQCTSVADSVMSERGRFNHKGNINVSRHLHS